ncbi:MAG: transporter, family, multidrug resistance protein [Pseudonocardiales bacterium]|nr:transporter, family, multidrug resistance protein [Pseudonocardiales bacterium]
MSFPQPPPVAPGATGPDEPAESVGPLTADLPLIAGEPLVADVPLATDIRLGADVAPTDGEPPRTLVRRGPLRGLPVEVAVLSAVAFFVAAGFGIVAPAIPVFARSFGVSRTAAGAVISAFALMRLLSALGCGRLVNRFGERLILGAGITIVALSSALAGLAANYGQLLTLRGVGGIGSAMFSVSASSLLLGATSSGQRGRAMGAFSGGFLLGGVAGPGLGGLVTGWSLRAPFFLYAGTLAAAGGVGLALLPRRSDRHGAGVVPAAQSLLSVRQALRLPAFRAAAGVNLADNWAAVGVRAALVPLLVVEVLNRSPIWTGIGLTVFTLGNIVTLTVGSRLADRRGRRPLLLAGCLGSAAGTALLVLPHSLPLFLAAMAVFGLGSGLLDVAPGAMLGDVAGGRGGTVVAAYQMAGDVGSLTGPVLAGALADTAGFSSAFALTTAVLLAAAVVAFRAPETLRRT